MVLFDLANNFWLQFAPQYLFILRVLLYFLPFFLLVLLWYVYLEYIRARYVTAVKWSTIEIKIPREIDKTPEAMEVVLSAFHQTSVGTLIDQYVGGRVHSWASLELVSVGGEVHFVMRVWEEHRNMIEAQIYSQYPDAVISEIDDYTRSVPMGSIGSDWEMWGAHLKFLKEDAYPIKTYIDYGLHTKSAKEEASKVDPMTALLEYMGSIRPGMQVWVQFVITMTKERYRKSGTLFARQDWRGDAQDLLKKLRKRDIKPTEGQVFPNWAETQLSSGEKAVLDSIERNMSKFAFDVGIRVIYLAKADKFDPTYIGGLLNSFKQFSSPDLNGFKPGFKTKIDYPWQDILGTKLQEIKEEIFDAYRWRSYFYYPHKYKPLVMSAEELATMYHFPGQVAKTPTLGRIESRRSEPPSNLPI